MTEFSVIIPLYNKEPYIRRALDSVLNQSYADFEMIVINDGSTDKGAEIVGEYTDPRVRLIHQENKGVSSARNKGIECAKGTLIAFLDADDEWLPEFMETIVKLSKKYPGAGMLTLAHRVSKEKNDGETPQYPTSLDDSDGILPNYFKSMSFDESLICSSSLCIPRDILDTVGGFKNGVAWGEDEDLWGRIALKYPVVFCSKRGAVVHFVDSHLNRLKPRMVYTQIHPFIEEAQKKISEHSVPDYLLDDLLEYIALLQIRSAANNLDVGNRLVARKILNDCSTKRSKKDKLWFYAWTFVPSKLYESIIMVKIREFLIFILGQR